MSRTADDGQSPARRNWVSPLARDASAVGAAAFARAGFADPALVLRWEEIAGPETARLACPIHLSQGRLGAVLTLKAEPGAALFLQHESRALCERINAFLGRQAVTRLKFVQGALAPRPALPVRSPQPEPVPPSDPSGKYQGPEGLREALRKLARARRSRTNMAP